MKPYTYLLINFLTIIICLIFSFQKRIQFYKHFNAFLIGSMLAAIPFIAWDIWFTYKGVWWFNMDYTIGINILGLPLEEWLFFICIPFSCVFTYFCIDRFVNLDWVNRYNRFIVWFAVVICISVAIAFYDRMYTLVTAMVTAGTMLYLYYIAKTEWIGKGSLVFLLLMSGFFPVNGILTGTGLESPIVNYNQDQILNLRMLTIPIEDFVYGYTLIMLNLYFFNRFKKEAYS